MSRDQHQPSRQSSRAGFTLVELLVVIGIIAVLVAILLPTLSSARRQAQRVACATQMRELVTATVMYCNENKGYLPEWRGYDKRIAFNTISDAGGTANMVMMGAPPAPSFPDFGDTTTPPNFGDGKGLGRLFARKYITNTKILICPSLTGKIVLNNQARPGYYYNPHYAKAVEDNSKYTARYKKIKDIPKDRCLLSEFFYDGGSIAHIDPKERSAYFNIAFSDGHVRTLKNKTARDRAVIAGWEIVRVADVIGILEFLDAGKSLDRQLGAAWDASRIDQSYYNVWPAVPN